MLVVKICTQPSPPVTAYRPDLPPDVDLGLAVASIAALREEMRWIADHTRDALPGLEDPALRATFADLQAMTRAVREVRNTRQLPPRQPLKVTLKPPADRAEAIRAQSAKVQVVTGATFTSEAFMQSLGSALTQARA